MSQFDGYKTKVILNRCSVDYGPITKFAPVLDIEKDLDTYILTFDDDIIVHRDVVKRLKEKSVKYPNACLAFSGICVGSFPFPFHYVIDNTYDCPVDWIQGVHVVAYKRKFFTTLNELITFGDDTPLKNELLFNDDHRISAYLASKNISRISIGYNIRDYLFRYRDGQDDALSSRRFTLLTEHCKIIDYFSKNRLYNHTYKITRSLFFYFVLGIFSGFCIFLHFNKIHILPRIFMSILSIIMIYQILRQKLGLKNFERILLI